MSEPIKIRATIKGSEGEVRVLMPHPMESGLRRDPSGQVLPAQYITSVILSLNGRPVVEGALGTAVSSNPLFAFQLLGVKAGDKVSVAWLDSKGQKGDAETSFSAA
ncbi:thiosulfate oxidation carrier complex protein SoxZ [Zoogloea sp.]|jgi:sulfur-oxidizing protein SoxZ|uniref:thiosulfate oxidation carrier complex protein SoxZ n=1 Tax=Zoogloea sp. TaxID=49181 RepID=UPI0037DA476C